MNTKFFASDPFIAFKNPFQSRKGPLQRGPWHFDQKVPTNHENNPPQTLPRASTSMETLVTRTLSMEQEFQMTTYSNSGLLQGDNVRAFNGHPAPPSTISLDDLNRMIREVQDIAADFQESFQEGSIRMDHRDLLKRLIIKSLFGKAGEDQELFFLDVTRNSFSFEFELDFEGILKTKGQAVYADLHFELHLEFSQEITHMETNFPHHQGLKRIAPNIVDTGRYFIGFLNATTLSIFDKETSLSTTIWGDPHVDLSDLPGLRNGEFSDLKKSSIRTTFKLLDSTEVVITAPDNGLIQGVDIFKGNQHVKGHGLTWNISEFTGLDSLKRFTEAVAGTFDEVGNGSTGLKADLLEDSDVVVAGGDGNDWYDETGKLIWGNR